MKFKTTLRKFLTKLIQKHLSDKPFQASTWKYGTIKKELPEINEWDESKIDSEMELIKNMQYIVQLATKHKWEKIKGNPFPIMLSFLKDDMRINVYPTTMTVSTVVNHPRWGRTQLHRKEVSMATLNTLFINPRTHTNKGYYRKT